MDLVSEDSSQYFSASVAADGPPTDKTSAILGLDSEEYRPQASTITVKIYPGEDNENIFIEDLVFNGIGKATYASLSMSGRMNGQLEKDLVVPFTRIPINDWVEFIELTIGGLISSDEALKVKIEGCKTKGGLELEHQY